MNPLRRSLGRPIRCIGPGRAFLAALFATLALAAPAGAAAPDFLFQIPSDQTLGTGAGQLNNPRDIVGNPDTGHLYVSEFSNSRISEFTAWGEFVRAWGWDVSPEGAPGDTAADRLEVCTTECQAGAPGSGPGQLAGPLGLTLDSAGDIYAYEFSNRRVQKFSPAGEFLLMFGDGVNQGPTTPGDVCTAADVSAGDTCGPGAGGDEPAQFDTTVGNYIAYNPVTGSIFVGDKDMIQEFNLDGTFSGSLPFGGELEAFDGLLASALDSDADGDLYVAFDDGIATPSREDNVYKLSATGTLFATVFPVKDVFALAVEALSSTPNLYAMEAQDRVLGFDASGNAIEGMGPEDGFAEFPIGIDPIGLGTNICAGSDSPGNLYLSTFGGFAQVAAVRTYGTAPIGCEAPPLKAPEITDQFAASVGVVDATLIAAIDPNFWTDTRYHVQYGPAVCLESGWTEGCQTRPVPPGSLLTSIATGNPVRSAGVFLTDLEPATTYHYRFIAQSSGSENRPVIGLGGKPGEAGSSAGFRTFPAMGPPDTDCPNQGFRSGPSAQLPDCRAYEMVSPLDKNNGDIVVALAPSGFPISFSQAAAGGDGMTYSAINSFSDPLGTPFSSQYLARRQGGGWSNQAISPPRTRNVGEFLDPEFKAFSSDLCQAWIRTAYDPPLAPGAVPGHFNLYRTDYCGDQGYEALTTVEPQIEPPGRYLGLELQGVSADGATAVYLAPDNLTAEAPPNTDDRAQLYVHANGEPYFACILPSGIATTQACAVAGSSGDEDGHGRWGSFDDALSADGSRLYWSSGPPTSSEGAQMSPQHIYLRQHPDRQQSLIEGGECVEPEAACTWAVSTLITPEPARFWAASEDGSKALFMVQKGPLAGNLYQFDLAKAEAGEAPNTLIAEQSSGLLGASDDLSRFYFASEEDLDGPGPALIGDPNLYLREADGSETTVAFVAALVAQDITELQARGYDRNFAAISHPAESRSSRVSPDGRHAAFTSFASLTGYDNTDALTGEPDAEVFLYSADAAELVCVSCNPTGARPVGRRAGTLEAEGTGRRWFAARLPEWDRSLYGSRLLSDDGHRLLFESVEALVPRDTNGMQDVYQWEHAGKGSCDGADSSFNPENGGCVELISSGTSGGDSFFLDAGVTGDDVFFTTRSSLVSPDYGLIDIYDARVGGGFTYPEPPKQCEGEACQSAPAAPDDPTPASSTFNGAGNVSEPRSCAPQARRANRLAARSKRLRAAAGRAPAGRSSLLHRRAAAAAEQASKARRAARRCRKATAAAQ